MSEEREAFGQLAKIEQMGKELQEIANRTIENQSGLRIGEESLIAQSFQAERVKELEADNARLREALQFYANSVVYQPDSVGRLDDLTSFAQKALNQKGGG